MDATVYEKVSAANSPADEQELWGKFEPRLCYASQISIKRAEFEKASQSARGTIDEFADSSAAGRVFSRGDAGRGAVLAIPE
jgi:hypothetical protein